jgi:6-pyruvoyltetrahydropterin/6-carboxytetrahydropterin synthase
LPEAENMKLYGKCNHPFGHGHDYILEVSLQGPVDESTGLMARTADLDMLVERRVLCDFHLRNLNEEIAAFASCVPTTENVAVEIRRLLEGWAEVFPDGPSLERVRLHETRRNIFEISGN